MHRQMEARVEVAVVVVTGPLPVALAIPVHDHSHSLYFYRITFVDFVLTLVYICCQTRTRSRTHARTHTHTHTHKVANSRPVESSNSRKMAKMAQVLTLRVDGLHGAHMQDTHAGVITAICISNVLYVCFMLIIR